MTSFKPRGRWLILLALLALAFPVTLVDTAYSDGGDDHQTAQTTPIELVPVAGGALGARLPGEHDDGCCRPGARHVPDGPVFQDKRRNV